MRRLVSAVLVLAVSTVPAGVSAQTAEPAAPAIDGAALGVSLSRIQRRLAAESQARSEGASPLRLEFFVDVYGTAPAMRFFAGQDLVYGGVPGSAPTHRDMLFQMTPQAFRSPRVDFLGMAYGAAMYGARRVQDWNYARELMAYKKLVEAGKDMPAPQPPRK